MFGMKTQEILIVLLILIILFGARKVPELARSLGASAKEFRRGLDEADLEGEDQTSA